MNQNPYLLEKLVKVKMQEIQREIQLAHLLHEGRIPKTSWVTRLVRAMLNLFVRKASVHQGQHSTELQSYRPCHDEVAK